jgi:hypothetical protein
LSKDVSLGAKVASRKGAPNPEKVENIASKEATRRLRLNGVEKVMMQMSFYRLREKLKVNV